MILHIRKIIMGAFLLTLLTNNLCLTAFDSVSNKGFLQEGKLIMKSLEEALKYIMKRPESVTGDLILGVLIATANLRWIYDKMKHNFESDFWMAQQLGLLLRQCHYVFEITKFGNVSLLNESLWENAAENLKVGFLSLHDDEFFPPELDSCESIDAYMLKGTPNDSDFCINELLKSGCQVSEYCWLSEINGDFHSGYKTSHRLLYFQVAFKLKCDEKNPEKFSGIRTIKTKLCQQMFLEAQALFQSQSIAVTRDLFLEQIALCGLEGYEEFAPDIWRNHLRLWQNVNGCYGLSMNFTKCFADGSERKIYDKTKMSDYEIDGCHTHVTAVAVSALAFFLRVTLNKALNLA